MPTHHTIDYIELSAPDLEANQAFYEAAFGWRFTPYGPDYAGIAHPAGGEQGGMERGPVTPGGPLVILASDDLEASLAAVVAAGGEITVPIFSFPGGRRFHFRDPAGNTLGVWSQAGAH